MCQQKNYLNIWLSYSQCILKKSKLYIFIKMTNNYINQKLLLLWCNFKHLRIRINYLYPEDHKPYKKKEHYMLNCQIHQRYLLLFMMYLRLINKCKSFLLSNNFKQLNFNDDIYELVIELVIWNLQLNFLKTLLTRQWSLFNFQPSFMFNILFLIQFD